ncbi:MAG: hypothetical protein LBC96_10195 [Lachnospiraceae bacterium]|nr:hypothetical protein [Lachnospiraceae bacterium]
MAFSIINSASSRDDEDSVGLYGLLRRFTPRNDGTQILLCKILSAEE